MSEFTSYYLYQRYEKRGNQDWIPCVPNVFSITGDTNIPMPVSAKSDCDVQCGCSSTQYRWVNLDPSIDWICDGTSKYYKQRREVSYDGGVTWIPLDEYQKGALIEASSSDCTSPTPTLYRWVNLDPNSDYYCNGTTKYYKQQRQVSYDGSTTWENVVPAEYQQGSVAESQSTDCGYVPPTPTGNTKFRATYTGGTTYEVECDSTSAVTTGDTRPTGYDRTIMIMAEIGDCVTYIGSNAFYGCTSLTGVTIPDSVTTIGNMVFQYCSGLTSIVIPDSVTSIGYQAFTNCTGLTSCTIGSGVTSISNSTFWNCYSLTSLTIPASVTIIGIAAFVNCISLTSIDIPSGVTSIGTQAFAGCSGLTSIVIPDSVTSIGDTAFADCSGLTSCTIGSGVTSIGFKAFINCTSLTSVIVNATTPPTLGSSVFNDTNNCPIYVPAGSVSAYQSAWSDYSSRIQAIP